MQTAEATKLAKLWMALGEVKDQIDNTVLPLGAHLGLEDPGLMIALEELSAKIEQHFERFKLEAVKRKSGRP
jgi:hypothetical protein